MQINLERVCQEQSFYCVEIIQPRGPEFLPMAIRTLLGDSFLVGKRYSKEKAYEKADEVRNLYRRNPHNKHVVRIKSIFD